MKHDFLIKLNIIFFYTLSFFFFVVLKSLYYFKGIFDLNMADILKSEYILFAFYIVALLNVFFVKKLMKITMSALFILLIMKTSLFFFGRFDKILLSSTILYSICALFLFHQISKITNWSIYNPKINIYDIGPNFYPPIDLTFELKNNEIVKGTILNWDSLGLFMLIDSVVLKKNTIIDIKISWRKYSIFLKGRVLMRMKNWNGYGISFVDDGELNKLKWTQYYSFLNDVGVKC